jgi:uncharacterized peroxidase-related enzyme
LPRPYLRLIPEDEADGLLREEYDAAVERAGKVFNILKAMSLNPRVLRASMELYQEIMFGESGLSRRERELLATVTSSAQSCHYWTVAHADDLRAEGADDEIAEHAAHDYRQAALSPRERALCDFAVKLTHLAAEVDDHDIEKLRAEGLDDATISDAIQVVGYFNYVTRVADGVGIEDEPDWSLH